MGGGQIVSEVMDLEIADGGTDLVLGPNAPQGQEKNWLATVPGKGYFAILRLYGPTEPASFLRLWPAALRAALGR